MWCHFDTALLQAGGASSGDGLCKSALDIDINAYDQRTEVCFGSTGEVRRFEEYLYGEWVDRVMCSVLGILLIKLGCQLLPWPATVVQFWSVL